MEPSSLSVSIQGMLVAFYLLAVISAGMTTVRAGHNIGGEDL